MSNLRCLCSCMVTSSDDCASRLSRRNVIGDAVFAGEKTFVCDPRPNCRNDVIWTDDPSTIEPTRACCPLSPSTPSVLSLHRANRLSSFFPRILLHRSTSRSLNPLCCQQREIGFLADTGPIYKIAIRSTLQNCHKTGCETMCPNISRGSSGHRAHQTSTP